MMMLHHHRLLKGTLTMTKACGGGCASSHPSHEPWQMLHRHQHPARHES